MSSCAGERKALLERQNARGALVSRWWLELELEADLAGGIDVGSHGDLAVLTADSPPAHELCVGGGTRVELHERPRGEERAARRGGIAIPVDDRAVDPGRL